MYDWNDALYWDLTRYVGILYYWNDASWRPRRRGGISEGGILNITIMIAIMLIILIIQCNSCNDGNDNGDRGTGAEFRKGG